jgi:hypothetical protein
MEGDIQGSLDRIYNALEVLGRIEEHLAVIAKSLERLSLLRLKSMALVLLVLLLSVDHKRHYHLNLEHYDN